MKPTHAAAGLALCLLLSLVQARMVVVEGEQPDDGYSLYFSSSSADAEELGKKPGFEGSEESPDFLRNPVDWLVESMEAVEALNRAMLMGSVLEHTQAAPDSAQSAEAKLQQVANSRFRGALLDYQQSQLHSASAHQAALKEPVPAVEDGYRDSPVDESYYYFTGGDEAYMDSPYEPQEGTTTEDMEDMVVDSAGAMLVDEEVHAAADDWKKEDDGVWEEFVDKYDEAEEEDRRARLGQDSWSLAAAGGSGLPGWERSATVDPELPLAEGEVNQPWQGMQLDELERQRLQELYLQQAVEDSYWRQQADVLDMLRSFIVLVVGPAQPQPPVMFLLPQQPQPQQVGGYYDDDQVPYAYGEYYEQPFGRGAMPGWGGVGEPEPHAYYMDTAFADGSEARYRPVMDWRLVDDSGSINWGVAVLLVLMLATAAVAAALVCSFTQLRQAMAGVGGHCCFGGADPELGSDGIVVPVEFEGADGKMHVGYMLVPPGACVMGKAGPELPRVGKAAKQPKQAPLEEQPLQPVVVAANEVAGANELHTPLLAGAAPSDGERASC